MEDAPENCSIKNILGEQGYVNRNCWLARNVNSSPSNHCQYCEIKFSSCVFFRYAVVSLILVFIILAIAFFIEGNISRSLIISIFVLVLTYGYYFDISTEKIIEANFAQKKAKESLEDLNKNLQQKVAEQTKHIRTAYEAEKIAKERIDATRVEDEAILSGIGEGVIAIGKNGEIMFINKSAEQMLDLKPGEGVNKKYDEIFNIENEKGETIKTEETPLYRALNLGKKITTDVSGNSNVFYCVRKDNSKFPVAITVAPIILDGKIIGAVDVFRDITIEKQINKSKSEFVSLASHQLRTPLSAIKWYSEMLLKTKFGQLSQKQKKYLKQVHHGNERMIRLIDVLLNVSRLEAGKIKANPTVIDAKKMMCDIVNEQKFAIKKKKQKIIFVCDDVLPGVSPKIFADENLIRMVFQNIVSNAVKYTPSKGKVTCSIDKKGKDILFAISDTGIGIPKSQQKRVFEKLFRADNALSHDPEGNGLGLYVAKATVENFGGKIWFESTEGSGTKFFVALPAA